MKEGENMESQQPKGPFCQSCGMPMEKPDDFGTNADGLKINDYCHFCFENGAFTDPDITMKQMIEKCTGIMATKMNVPEIQAKSIINEFIPKLKRWRGK